jgi:hypothetical protein
VKNRTPKIPGPGAQRKHGNALNSGGPILCVVVLFGLSGCIDEGPQPTAPDESVPAISGASAAFDAENTVSIEGRVIWDGEVPEVPPLTVVPAPDLMPPDVKAPMNPFRPLINPASKGVEDVIVFLRGVDSARARPWPHAPVRVEQTCRQIAVVQGEATSRFGFVRRGDSFESLSRDSAYHALRARGAAFFTLPFVDADRPSRRRLDNLGVVELSSGAGLYWLHARLLVVDHPYYTRTDHEGRFRLEQVPAGRYEAVCWMPSWVVARKDRDPESGLISRVVFAPAVEWSAAVTVDARAVGSVQFALSMKLVVEPK